MCSSLSRSFEQTLLLELEMVAVSAIECRSNRAIIYHKRSDIVTLGLLVELWRVDLAVLRPLRDCTLLAQHTASSCRESALIRAVLEKKTLLLSRRHFGSVQKRYSHKLVAKLFHKARLPPSKSVLLLLLLFDEFDDQLIFTEWHHSPVLRGGRQSGILGGNFVFGPNADTAKAGEPVDDGCRGTAVVVVAL